MEPETTDDLTAGMSEMEYSERNPLDHITPRHRRICHDMMRFRKLPDDAKLFNKAWGWCFHQNLKWPLSLLLVYDYMVRAACMQQPVTLMPVPSDITEEAWMLRAAAAFGSSGELRRMIHSKNFEFQSPITVAGSIVF